MRKIARHGLAAGFAAALALPALAQDGDPVAGEKVFKKCAACHSLEMDGPSKAGPNLHGIVGRTTGAAAGFKYSDVLMQAGQDGHVWTGEELTLFVENPKKRFPGTKMTFAGLKKPEERANVVAYLLSVAPTDAVAPATN